LNQLKKLGKKLGRKPTDRDINEACKRGETASVPTFSREFGSLIKAYESAGFKLKKPLEYTKAEIIRKLQELTRQLGSLPGYNDIKRASKEGKCPSPNTIYKKIGPLETARKIARLSSLISTNGTKTNRK